MPRATLSAFAEKLAIADKGDLTPSQMKTEILSGLTVALALVPEAVAFAFVAGVHPWSACMRRSLSAW